MAFRTKLDFSSNRQVKQHIETFTVLSGGTSFGVPFSSLPTGPNLATSGITFSSTTVLSTFSGNSATTVYSWYNPEMNTAINSLSAITPSNSGNTQYGLGFAPTAYITVDGNTVATAYSGVAFDISIIYFIDLGGGNYSGSVQSDLIEYLSASTLDFTGRTIWNDVSGITRTQDLIITNTPIIGNSWICIDSEGKGAWSGTPVWVLSAGPNSAILNGSSSVASGSFSVVIGANITGTTDNTTYVDRFNIKTLGSGTTINNLGIDSSGNVVVGSVGSGSSTTSPITIVNTSNLFSTGLANTGLNASGVTNSNFFGPNAGNGATGASYSNFFGLSTGYQATNANDSNFFGIQAGLNATHASFSNFLGYQAGASATGATQSNFLGQNTGNGATSASYSNFMGASAGYLATNANESNFLGRLAGHQATNANNSNFMGFNAGYLATGANNSNFLGQNTGFQATGATYSNFMGFNAGRDATGAYQSNFMGRQAGQNATGAFVSNFLGNYAGYGATNAFQSNFLGNYAGLSAINANDSNFFGAFAGGLATGASDSNFFGNNAGANAMNANNSNFIGVSVGSGATNASYANFIGNYAGQGATNANQSNFIGLNTGKNAIWASFANFIGSNAGQDATGATESNFLGYAAGSGAINASTSNFIGFQAGFGATGASRSNIFGLYAGMNAINASYSNLFGFNVANSFNSIGSNNIIIGTNITLPFNTTNSINLGGVLFGTGTYSAITGNPSTSGQTQGMIGVNVVTPTESLDVSGNARFRTIGSSASSGALYYTSTGVLTTNTSDNRLKHNIQTLTNALDKVKQLRGVSYDWIDGDGPTRIGFIAQEVEDVVPELTFINNNSPEKYMGVHYENTVALLVEAIKELTSGTTLVGNLQTQTILAEDNNIDLNHNGTPTTALGGGITVLHGMGVDMGSEFITNADGNWITNNDFIPNKLTIPTYSPSGSTDINGNLGNVTRDEDYLYIKTTSGWKRTNLESF